MKTRSDKQLTIAAITEWCNTKLQTYSRLVNYQDCANDIGRSRATVNNYRSLVKPPINRHNEKYL